MRYFVELSYNGGAYHGWQIQSNAITVQEVLNQALSTILRTEIETIGSGRTDTGVHASVQVVHFDVESTPPDNLVKKLNSLLPKDIAVHSFRRVKDEVSARFEATNRSYIYHIIQQKNPFKEGLAYFYHRELDITKMNKCCEVILNWTDFESFSKVHTDVNTFECVITDARWTLDNDTYTFYVSANRFLRGMVRALVGTMLLAGEGKINDQDFLNILKAKDRKKAGRAVPACGLYLSEVKYPDEVYL